MKIKEQTSKLAAGCSKYSFEVADNADVVWIGFSKSIIKILLLIVPQFEQKIMEKKEAFFRFYSKIRFYLSIPILYVIMNVKVQ